jgi:hypothetical protein
MREQEPYGFAIYPQISFFKLSYDIVDLATDKKMFSVKKDGSFKHSIYIYNYSGKEIIRAKKTSAWKSRYTIEKKGFQIASLTYSGGICDSTIYLDTESQRYIGSRVKGSSYQFIDTRGKAVFYFERSTALFHSEYTLEVHEGIQPEIAMIASIIIDLIIRAQQAAAVSATTAATS